MTISNQTFERCIEECLQCSRWCSQCRTESLNEDPIMMRDCIRLCNECLELCRTCALLLTRQCLWRCWVRCSSFLLGDSWTTFNVQIGLVMLIGLSAKNSILIVEFAEQLIAQGRTTTNAAIEAAELRLRPILMTSFAFLFGVLPLYFASGAGKLGRHSVGTAIVGGMLFSTVLNLFFIPVLYVILKTVLVSLSRKKGKAELREQRLEVA